MQAQILKTIAPIFLKLKAPLLLCKVLNVAIADSIITDTITIDNSSMINYPYNFYLM
jgi:hypothetical protein